MKVGLFGGSFDPIHVGHIEPVRGAQRELGLDQVIYLPTAQPPHKSGAPLTPAGRRLRMVELALLGEDDFLVSDFEATANTPAYTVDSVRHFRQSRPADDLYLLLGSDSFAQLPTWKEWSELIDLVEIGVLLRQDDDLEDTLSEAIRKLLRSPRVHLCRSRMEHASSTSIREMLAEGKVPPGGWLPESVLTYIRKYNLYR